MDKKIFGIKLGTYLTVLLSLVCAVIFWLYVKIVPQDALSSMSAVVTNVLRFNG